MIERLVASIWGKFKGDEHIKFWYLALAAFFLVGAQWPLHILRDSVFINTVGSLSQPNAKLLALLFCIPLTLFYTWLVEWFPREKTLYVLAGVLSGLACVFALLLHFWASGLIHDGWILGWAFYIFADSFSVLTIAPFWAFINDVTYPGEAKRGYGLVVFGGQFGGLFFTTLASILSRHSVDYSSQPPLIAISSAMLLVLYLLPLWRTTHAVRAQNLVGYRTLEEGVSAKAAVEEPEHVGFFSGLKLILARPYVAGICIMTAFQELISTLLSYKLYRAIELAYDNPIARHIFIFDYSLVLQIVATLFALFGTSYFQQRIGVRGCLIGYPVLLIGCVCIASFSSVAAFVAIAAATAKALNFALNKPVREILYIPTSREVKYKSKAWIEFFGARASKMIGATFNKVCGEIVGSIGILAIGISAAWIIIAGRVGALYNKTVEERVRIE